MKKNHRKNGSFRRGNQAAALPPGARRVVLPAQRVRPETLATLREAGVDMGGVGRAIDTAATSLRILHRHIAGPAAPGAVMTRSWSGGGEATPPQKK